MIQTHKHESMCFIYIQYLQRHIVIDLLNIFVRLNVYNIA